MIPRLDGPVFASPRARRRALLHAAIALALVVAASVLLRRELALLLDPVAVRDLVGGFGPYAPLVFVVLQAAQVLLAPIPGQVLAVAAGYLFGPYWGTLYNMIGVTIGSTAAFWLSRRFGRAYVSRVVNDDVLARFDAILQRHGLVSLFVLFLIPGLPDDVLCFVGGLTPIPLRKLVLVAVLGRAPAFFLVNVFGDSLARGDTPMTVALLALIVGLSLAGYRYRDRLAGLFARYL